MTMKKIMLLLFLLMLSSAVIIIHDYSLQAFPSPSQIEFYALQNPNIMSTVIGRIAQEPEERPSGIKIVLESQQHQFSFEEGFRIVAGKMLIFSDSHAVFQKNDLLSITGNLSSPKVLEDFDYPGFLSQFQIYSLMSFPKITLLAHANAHSFQDRVFLPLQKNFQDRLTRLFPLEPVSSLLRGLLIGNPSLMPVSDKQAFQKSGLSHIMAVSGYNITLLITVFLWLFKPFKKSWSLGLTAFGILFYTIFVGASASVMRASIMGLISLLALSTERKGNAIGALFIAVLLMTIWNPLMARYDPGFHLSVAATFGLIVLVPWLSRFASFLPETLGIRDSILFTISAQITTLPIIVFHFQSVSLVAPLSNLLITGPILPFTMLFSFFATLVSFISFDLGKIIGYPAWILGGYIVEVARQSSHIPFATISIPKVFAPLFFLVLLLGGLMLWRKNRERTRYSIVIRRLQGKVEQKIFQMLYQPVQ